MGLRRRLLERDPFVLYPALVVAVIVVIVAVAVVSGLPPSRASVEKQVVRAPASRFRAPLVATCTEPTRTGWQCRLRDAAGRRGWWFENRYTRPGRFTETAVTTDGDFPVLDPDGRRPDVVVVLDDRRAPRALGGSLLEASVRPLERRPGYVAYALDSRWRLVA